MENISDLNSLFDDGWRRRRLQRREDSDDGWRRLRLQRQEDGDEISRIGEEGEDGKRSDVEEMNSVNEKLIQMITLILFVKCPLYPRLVIVK